MRIALRWGAAVVAAAVLLGPELAVLLTHPGSAPPLPWVAWTAVVTTPAVWHTWLLLVVLSGVGAAYLALTRGAASGAGEGPDTTFGTARWGQPERADGVARWTAGRSDNPAGLVVGAVPAKGRVQRAWVSVQDGHALLIGAPGTRKSTSVLLPTLAVIGQGGAGLVVTDPKGELYASASGLLSLDGYTVVRVDFRNPADSASWNALGPVGDALGAGDAAGASRAARELASVLAEQGAAGGKHSAFFRQSTTALLTALVLLVADQAPPDARHLGSVYRTLIEVRDLDAVFDALPPDHPAALAYGPVRLSGQETRQNQLTVAATALGLWADPGVVALTGRDSVDWTRLATDRLAVFIVIPDESSAFYGAAALFVQQQLQALSQAAARQPGQRLPRPVYWILDEFGNLPVLPDFDKTLNVGRGKGIRLVLAVQALAQISARYGDRAAEAMQNACATWVYLGGNDVTTARVISEKTGQSTVRVLSESRMAGGHQNTTSYTGRPLLTPDEVLRWPWGHALVQQMGALPLKLGLRRYTDWPGAWGPMPEEATGPAGIPPLWRPGLVPPAAPPTAEGFRILRAEGD